MTTLHEQIAALPEWPPPLTVCRNTNEPWVIGGMLLRVMRERDAALARLELLREWMTLAHQTDCDVQCKLGGRCTCGRDALLKATEVPR